jgi:hypothetical protein
VDGTYLHGRLSGKLLIVVAFDTYNRILPLAYTLVKEENNVNWRCSYNLFIITLQVTIYIYIYKIPDKHAGIKHGLIEI